MKNLLTVLGLLLFLYSQAQKHTVHYCTSISYKDGGVCSKDTANVVVTFDFTKRTVTMVDSLDSNNVKKVLYLMKSRKIRTDSIAFAMQRKDTNIVYKSIFNFNSQLFRITDVSRFMVEYKSNEEDSAKEYNIRLMKVVFAPKASCLSFHPNTLWGGEIESQASCYYIPVNGNNNLRRSINQKRVAMMRDFFQCYYISDSPSGWKWSKKKAEQDTVGHCGGDWAGQDSDAKKEIIIDGYYQTKTVISLSYYWYWWRGESFHDAEGRCTCSFDKISGKLITAKILIKDYKRLIPLAEKYFRKQHNLSPDADISHYGNYFNFEEDFVLPSNPENFEFTKWGLRFYYEVGEIDCYRCGCPAFIIPYSQLKGIINDKYLPK